MPVQNIDVVDPRISRPGVDIYCENTMLSLLHVGTSVPVVDLRTVHRVSYDDSRGVVDTCAVFVDWRHVEEPKS
eukprot:3531379-Lingulodinium_polyedra.AAC.1